MSGEEIVSPDYVMANSGDMYTLTIPEVFDEDAGTFTVEAENSYGTMSCSAQLQVDVDECKGKGRSRRFDDSNGYFCEEGERHGSLVDRTLSSKGEILPGRRAMNVTIIVIKNSP